MNGLHTPILLFDGAHGSTTPDFDADVCQVSFDSGALLSHGSGFSWFVFANHGSADFPAFDAKLPLAAAAAAALFCSQPSFDEPDAIDGE